MSVTNGNDSGLGSLRNAIDAHISNIVFISPAVPTITLDSPLVIPRNLTIYGSRSTITVSNAAFSSHVFKTAPGVSVTFLETTFQGNASNSVGLIDATDAEQVRLVDCEVKGWVSQPTTHLIQANDAHISITKTDFIDNTVGTLVHTVRSQGGDYELTFEDIKLTGNTLSQGALGCSLTSGSQKLTSVYRRLTFDSNTLDHSLDITTHANLLYHGGSTSATSGSTTLIEDVSMTNNTGIGVAPGIRLPFVSDSELTLRRVYVDENSASGTRASDVAGIKIVYLENAVEKTLTLDKVSVRGNASSSAVGLHLQLPAQGTSTAHIRHTAVINNVSTAASSSSLSLLGDGTAYHLLNVTVAGNTSNHVGGVHVQTADQKIFRNVTIANNHGPVAGGLLAAEGSAPILFNTLIADNWSDPTRTTRSDVVGQIATNSFNNLVSDSTGMTGITHDNRGNKVGTGAAPIAALLGSIANHGGDHHIWSIALQEGSPAINAGANVYIPQGTENDSRGFPMTRIYGTVVDIGSFEWQPVSAPCFAGDSLVRVKVIATKEVKSIRADELVPGEHLVYDILEQQYVPIVAVSRVTSVHGAYSIPQYSIQDMAPYRDMIVACCQQLLVEGQSMRVEDIESAVKLDSVDYPIYAIVCDRWRPIEVSGLGIYTWSGPSELIV